MISRHQDLQTRQPIGRDIIQCKWVKLGPSNQVDKNIARYLAKGFKQVKGLVYFETFAPTWKPETFTILPHQSAKQGKVIH